MPRVDNFNAGPAGLPLAALERAQKELLDFEGTGMSIMEHSHRGKAYDAVHKEAIALVRELLDVPDSYHVLLLQGGASQQFATVPMNLLPADKSADYIMTGAWSDKAYKEAGRIGKVRVAATTAVEKKYTRVPKASELDLDPSAAYVHMTSNNTIFGTQFMEFPDTKDVPLVADMSSDILWRKIDVKRFGLIYAGAQKNIGPSGVTLVIIRKDLSEGARTDIPAVFRYETHAAANSLYNTAPTFGIYLMRNVLDHIKGQGGLDAMEKHNRKKGEVLYGAIDELSSFYKSPVEKESRSLMNVVFRLPSEELEAKFVADAAAKGMVGLKGHRSVGGIRASTYNAVSLESVQRLVGFMREFAQQNK